MKKASKTGYILEGENGFEHKVTLLCAKTKITPVDGCTVAKRELNGCTLLSRLLRSSVNAMIDKPEVVIPGGDS